MRAKAYFTMLVEKTASFFTCHITDLSTDALKQTLSVLLRF